MLKDEKQADHFSNNEDNVRDGSGDYVEQLF